MSRTYPDFAVGEGDTGGYHGVSSEWPYIVELDNEGDDPWPVLWTENVIGSKHPDPQLKDMLFISDYRKEKRLNEKTWRFLVIFSPPSADTIGLWRRSGRLGNETRKLLHSLANYNDAGALLDESIPIGSAHYALASTDPAATTNKWDSAFMSEDGKKINRTKAVAANVGIDVNDGILPLSYEITVPRLTRTTIRDLMNMRWCTNKYSWPIGQGRGGAKYGKWSLMFSSFAFEDDVLLIGGAFPIWFSHCQIELLYRPFIPYDDYLNPYGWRGRTEYDYYDDMDGSRTRVYDVTNDNKFVKKNYILYDEIDFSNLFALFGSQPEF